MGYKAIAGLGLALSLLVNSIAYAEVVFVKGTSSNSGTVISLDSSYAGKTIAIDVTSPSIDQQTLDLVVSGPIGTKISAKSYVTTSADNVASLYSQGKGDVLTLFPVYSYKGVSSFSIGNNSSGSSSSSPYLGSGGDPNCGCLPPAVVAIQQVLFPGFCSQFPPVATCGENTSGSSSSAGQSGDGVSAKGFISVNRCMPAARPSVLVQIDLSAVSAADLSGSISVKTTFHAWDGNRRASIKPKSDGKFGPVPLLLAGQVYGGGGEPTVTLLNYKGKKLNRKTTLKIADNIYYRGNSYWRVVIGKVLRGGKGTFEMRNGAEGYSICAKLVKSRQRFNGYTN